MMKTVEELLELAGDMNKMISPPDMLSELIETTMAQYRDRELQGDELELVTAAGKALEKRTDGIKWEKGH